MIMKNIIIKDKMTETERWLQRMEEQCGRITGPRRAIVDLMVATDRALTPVDVFDQARKEHPRMGLVTVYRTLELLTSLGLVDRVHHLNGCHAYLRAARGHEHLLVCRDCGRAVFFQGDDLDPLIHRISSESGFAIFDHWLQLHGVCVDCQVKGNNNHVS